MALEGNAKRDNRKRQSSPVDLMDVLVAIRINIVFILIVVAIGLAGMIAYLQTVSPTYQSDATIRIKQARSLTASQIDPEGVRGGVDSALITTYTDILKSRSVIEPVLEDMAYDSNGRHIAMSYEGVKGAITTVPAKNSQLVTVSFKSENPAEAQRANGIILDSFMKRLTEIDRQQAMLTSKFIEDRTKDSQKNLKAAEDALNAFQKKTKTVNADATVKDAAAKVQNVDNMRATNQIALATAQAQQAAVQQQEVEISEPLAENPTILGIQGRLVEMETKRIALTEKFTPKHPNVIALNEEIAALNDRMNEEIQRVASEKYANKNGTYQGLIASQLQAEVQIAIANANLAEIDKIDAKHKEDINKLSDDQRDYLRLMRDVNVAQEVYMMLAKRLEEAKVAEVSVTRDVFIVDEPSMPKAPIAPNKPRLTMIAGLVALALAVAFVVARERFNKAILTAEDVDRYLGIPVLGQVPSYEAMDKFRHKRRNRRKSSLLRPWRALWKK